MIQMPTEDSGGGGPCPCGLDRHLCPGARMMPGPGPDEIYAAGLRAARRWQADERLAAGVR